MVTTELLPTYIVHSPQGVGYIGSIYSTIAINFLKRLSPACNTFKIEPLDWPIKKAINVDLPFRLKGNLKHNFGYLNKALGAAFQTLLAGDLLSTKCSLSYPLFHIFLTPRLAFTV